MNIYINDTRLVLPPQTRIPAVFNNPFFSADGSHSFEITIPYRENALTFGFPALPSSTMRKVDGLAARIDLGARIFNCSCRVTRAGKLGISLFFFFEESNFYRLINDKSLTDIPYGDTFQVPVPSVACAFLSPGQNIYIPPSSQGVVTLPFTSVTIPVNPLSAFTFSMLWNYTGALAYFVGSLLQSPFVINFLCHIDHTFFPIDGEKLFLRLRCIQSGTSTVIADFETDITDKSAKLVLQAVQVPPNTWIHFQLVTKRANGSVLTQAFPYYVNHFNFTVLESTPDLVMDPDRSDYNFFPSMYEAQYYDPMPGIPPTHMQGYANNYSAQNKIQWVFNNVSSDLLPFVNLLVPSFFCRYIVSRLSVLTGYSIILPPIADFQNLVVLGLASLVYLQWFTDTSKPLYRSSFTPAEVLPSVPVSKFLTALEQATGSFIAIDEASKTLTFELRRDIIAQVPAQQYDHELISLEYGFNEKPSGFRVFYKDHPDPYFNTYYKSLEGFNYKGVTNKAMSEISTSQASINDCYLIQGAPRNNNTFVFFNGVAWQFLSRFPQMEVLHNTDSANVFDYEISLFPILSALATAPHIWINPVSHFIPHTRLALHPVSSLTVDALRQLPLCFSVFRGVQQFRNSDRTYLMLSHDTLNSDGDPIADADLSLQITQPRGLYEKYLKDYIFFLIYRNDTFEAYFSPASDMVFFRRKISVNGSEFMISSQEFEFIDKKVSAIRAELRLVN